MIEFTCIIVSSFPREIRLIHSGRFPYKELAERLTASAEDAFGVQLVSPEPNADAEFPEWQILAGVVAALTRESEITGVSGAQGSGKSSFARVLGESWEGRQPVIASLDDFYLTRAERMELARTVHPLLQTRGVPGTHAVEMLLSLAQGVNAGSTQHEVPRFDKGRDDRSGIESLRGDSLVIEGWCLGVTRQPDKLLTPAINRLEESEDLDGRWRSWVNTQIARYEPVWDEIDFWVHLRVPSFDEVIRWRSQQEEQIPTAQRMSHVNLLRFVQHYERLTRWMWENEPRGPGVLVQLDTQHRIEGWEFITA